MKSSLFYDLKHHLKSSGFGGAIKPGEEDSHGPNQFIPKVLVEKPLAFPGSALRGEGQGLGFGDPDIL